MSIKAISRMGNNERCDFYDENKNNLYYTLTTINKEHALTSIFNNENKLIADISYIYSKSHNTKDDIYLEIKNQQKLKFSLDSKNNLVCEQLKLRINRGILDKSFKLYIDDKLVMSARTFTFVRDWLVASYNIKIFEKSNELICICSCVLMFIIISLKSIESARNYMGNFK